MTKAKFLKELSKLLKDLPKDEVKERLNFYSEMIDDRIEDGLSEEEAIKSIGSTLLLPLLLLIFSPLLAITNPEIITLSHGLWPKW